MKGQLSRDTVFNQTLAEHAAAIHQLGRRLIADVVEIGHRLTEAKKVAGHGNWLPWLHSEFGWIERTALNFMRVYELSKQTNPKTFSNLNLSVSALYLLAAPSTPTEARDEIIDRAEAGETVPVGKVKRIIKDSKSCARSSSKTDKSKPQPQVDETAKAAAPKPKPDDFDAPLKPAHDVIARRLHKQFGEAPLAVQQHFIPYFLEYMRCDIDPPSAGEISARDLARKDAEIERLRAIQRHLENKITELESEIAGLESELEELRGKLAMATAGGVAPPAAANDTVTSIADLLLAWNTTWCKPPLDYDELKDVVDRIALREANRIRAQLNRGE
jgi:hypothetical protein